jgi:hypothetical protein
MSCIPAPHRGGSHWEAVVSCPKEGLYVVSLWIFLHCPLLFSSLSRCWVSFIYCGPVELVGVTWIWKRNGGFGALLQRCQVCFSNSLIYSHHNSLGKPGHPLPGKHKNNIKPFLCLIISSTLDTSSNNRWKHPQSNNFKQIVSTHQ